MSAIMDHAKRELTLINEEPDVVESYLKIIEVWEGMGHSGGSASIAIPTITALLSQQNLSPLTDNPDEWCFHGPDVWGAEGGVWQNKRNGEAFSNDGGKTYYLLSEGAHNLNRKPMHQARTTHQFETLRLVKEAKEA